MPDHHLNAASCCVAAGHKSEEIMKLNPRGQVPTFVDEDGVVVNESLAALLYLQDKYPSPSLLPATVEKRALVRVTRLLLACLRMCCREIYIGAVMLWCLLIGQQLLSAQVAASALAEP